MKEGDPYLVVLVTVPRGETGNDLARRLLEEGLAACVNRIPSVRSLYRWKGKIESDEEELLLIKTSRERMADLEKRIEEMHPYNVPEMLALSVRYGSEPYLDWLGGSLHPGEG